MFMLTCFLAWFCHVSTSCPPGMVMGTVWEVNVHHDHKQFGYDHSLQEVIQAQGQKVFCTTWPHSQSWVTFLNYTVIRSKPNWLRSKQANNWVWRVSLRNSLTGGSSCIHCKDAAHLQMLLSFWFKSTGVLKDLFGSKSLQFSLLFLMACLWLWELGSTCVYAAADYRAAGSFHAVLLYQG